MLNKLIQIQASNSALRLVSAKQAPFIISSIMSIFGSETETGYSRFKSELELLLKQQQRNELATSLINEWLRQGWIRESNDTIFITESFNSAKNFYLSSLDQVVDTNASRFTLFSNMVDEFAFNLTSDPNEQIRALEEDIKKKQAKIQEIKSGRFVNLSAEQKSEVINEVAKLGAELTRSFDTLEDEVNNFYQSIKEVAIIDHPSPGRLLEMIFSGEEALRNTQSGSAFERFFLLFSNQTSIRILSERINLILNVAGQYLSPSNFHLLENIIATLNKKSTNVLKLRRRFAEDLRNFVQSGQYENIKGITKELASIKQMLIDRKSRAEIYNQRLFELEVGSVRIRSPFRMKIELPEARIGLDVVLDQTSFESDTAFEFKESRLDREEKLLKLLNDPKCPYKTLGEFLETQKIDGVEAIQYYLIACDLGLIEDGTESFVLRNDERKLNVLNFKRVLLEKNNAI